jgi:hypothetical protein
MLYDDAHLLQMLDSIANLIKDGSNVNNFITEIVNQISQETYITRLGDSLAYYISNTTLGDTVLNYIANHFSNKLGDTILNYITNHFPTELGDTILKYITNHVTQELTNNIMAKVNIASANNTVTVKGNGTSNIDLSVNIPTISDSLVSNNTFVTNLGTTLVNNETYVTNLGNKLVSNPTYITNLGDSLAYHISNTTLGDTILNFITNKAPVVKQATIAVVNGEFDTKNLIFRGTTSVATNALKVVAIEPVFSNLEMCNDYLTVAASVQVVGNAAKWRINIENRNISTAKKCTLQSVIISYICDDETLLSSDTQGITERMGY